MTLANAPGPAELYRRARVWRPYPPQRPRDGKTKERCRKSRYRRARWRHILPGDRLRMRSGAKRRANAALSNVADGRSSRIRIRIGRIAMINGAGDEGRGNAAIEAPPPQAGGNCGNFPDTAEAPRAYHRNDRAKSAIASFSDPQLGRSNLRCCVTTTQVAELDLLFLVLGGFQT